MGGDLDRYPLSAALHSAARSCGVTLGHAARFVRRKHRPGSGGITYTHNQKHRLQDKGVWYSCKAEGGKAHMNASEPELVKSFVDVDALSTWLVDHDVDLTGYGRGQAKSIQQLWREVSHRPAAFAKESEPTAQSSAGRRRRNSLQCVRQSSNTLC